MNNVTCLVPVRVDSNRLPYKHLYEILSVRILDLIYQQLYKVFKGDVIFCVPDTQPNDFISNYIEMRGWRICRGSEANVLARLQKAAANVGSPWIARVNGDNVIILQDMLRHAISYTTDSRFEVITNVRPRSYPKGCSVELVRRDKFLSINSDRLTEEHCEHVFPYIYDTTSQDKIKNITSDRDYSDIDLSCDDFKQLELLRYIHSYENKDWQTSDLPRLQELTREFYYHHPFTGKSGVFTIAEVGGNHEGDFGYAVELVTAACATNVDAVKLQIYSPELLVNQSVDSNRFEHFKRFSLKYEQYIQLFDIINKSGKQVGASIWSLRELDIYSSYIDFIKIGSGDLTDVLILDAISRLSLPVILSTGLARFDEIDVAMARLDYKRQFNRIGLLQCTSMYPIPEFDANLLIIDEFSKRYGVCVGYSDHTVGCKALELSVAVGARIQEFHFTDSRDGKTFRDHMVSLNPGEVQSLIQSNIKTMTMLGGRSKNPALSEVLSGHVDSFRKGLYFNRDMMAGEIVTASDLVSLRPVEGIPASSAFEIVGRVMNQAVSRLQPLDFTFFK